MKKRIKWIVIAIVLLGLGVLLAPSFIMGRGSKRYAQQWVNRLSPYDSLSAITNAFECLDVTGKDGQIGWSHAGDKLTLLTFTNDTWLVLHAANSHGKLHGGTLVTRDSTGATRVFFGHVCGSETLRGNTLHEAYSNLMSAMDRKEVFLDDE